MQILSPAPVKEPRTALSLLPLLLRRAAHCSGEHGEGCCVASRRCGSSSSSSKRLRDPATLEAELRRTSESLCSNLGCLQSVFDGGKLCFETREKKRRKKISWVLVENPSREHTDDWPR